MSEDRFILSDQQWSLIEPLCLGKKGDPGRSGSDNRLFVESVLWIGRTGCSWRDLPPFSGRWNTVFKRFRYWVKSNVFKDIFDILSKNSDMEYTMIDATIVKVHRHGQGAKGGTQTQAIGKSRGGISTKILALVDGLGNLVRFILMPGQRGETTGVVALMEGIECGSFLGDKAYDADWLREMLAKKGIEAVIPARKGRKAPALHDKEKYKWRHLIENYFQKLKEFKRIAMRSCKTDTSFSAMIYICSAVINSR